MRILVAANAYNERPYIPFMVDYYRSQGCELFIADNYSNDGTYEWLIENKVSTKRVDTNESFFLQKLNEELTKSVRELKPDWVVYCGIDIYYFFPESIQDEIKKAEHNNCNVIEVSHFTAYNTGETLTLPFYKNYFHVGPGENRKLKMIAKFTPELTFAPDRLRIGPVVEKVHVSDGVLINYGMCKPKQEREETFMRRRRAWKLGENVGHGIHYKPAQEKNWTWRQNELLDIRKTRFYKMFQ